MPQPPISPTPSSSSDLPPDLTLSGLTVQSGRALTNALRRSWRHLLLAFALGVVFDMAVSPYLLKILPVQFSIPMAPTLGAWLFLTPVLLAHCLSALLRPAVLKGPLDTLTSPPPGSARLWWCGPLSWWTASAPFVSLLMLSLPDLESWRPALPWIFGGWLAALAFMACFAAVPAAAVDGIEKEVSSAWKIGPLVTLKIAVVAGFGAAIAFVLDHTLIALLFLPLSKVLPNDSMATGLLVILLTNIFMTLAVPIMAVVGATGWQASRRWAWERSLH